MSPRSVAHPNPLRQDAEYDFILLKKLIAEKCEIPVYSAERRRIIEALKDLLEDVCRGDPALSDTGREGSEAMQPHHRIIGRLYCAIGEIVADEQNRVRLRLSSHLPAEGDQARSLTEAIEAVNDDLEQGFELPDRNAIGHEIRFPLDEGMVDAIANSLRQITSADVKVAPLDPVSERRK
ncbi:MAG: hypothetical protein JSS02_25450 [Planctomycetes bacterium]|nr:hypothetical protein [Planctomycetota bacterium]